MSCDCGSGEPYEACCGPIIEGTKKAETAEQLMRSRYTAYARGHIDHIMASHDPKTVDDVDREGAVEWSDKAEWHGLTVHTSKGGADEDEGTVEFTARYTIEGKTLKHRELATFKRVDGAWFYIDGDMVKPRPVVRDTRKVGRNEPCTCGSGKKYKKCCGR